MSIFRWSTMKGVAPLVLQYSSPVSGKEYEIELICGATVRVWRADNGQDYFCHGLTFDGKSAPGGSVSPCSGQSVQTILANHFDLISEEKARPDDILVWKGLYPETPHSAIVIAPIIAAGLRQLDEATTLRSKNGMRLEAERTLAELIHEYGESYDAYRKR